MYAIIKTGGKQYRVAEGDFLKVETLNAAEEILRKEAAENGKLEIFTNDENK